MGASEGQDVGREVNQRQMELLAEVGGNTKDADLPEGSPAGHINDE